MKRTLIALLLSLASLGLSSHAYAVLVDPTDFPTGTDVSNAYTGVTLARAQGSYYAGLVVETTPLLLTSDLAGPVFASGGFFAHLGGTIWSAGPCCGQDTILRANFANPVSTVTVLFMPDDNDAGVLQAFDALGNLLEGKLGVSNVPFTLTVSGGATPIAYILATYGDTGRIARLEYVAVVPDTTPPVLNLPANITVDATSPAGATVSYTVTATDNSGVTPTVSCIPLSGLTFAIGTTTVSCTATDGSGNSSTGSFTVTVNGAVEQLQKLISSIGIYTNPWTTSLDAKLQNAMDALTAMKRGKSASACNLLRAFTKEVQAQSGQQLTVAMATQLIASANQIRAVLGCS